MIGTLRHILDDLRRVETTLECLHGDNEKKATAVIRKVQKAIDSTVDAIELIFERGLEGK